MNTALAQLADAGFDLVHAFDAHVAAREPGWEVLAHGEAKGILIGNTRALWPHFVAALRDPTLAAEPDPLDRYTAAAIATAVPHARVYFAHRRHQDAFLPFQRLAIATGLGVLSPGHLVIHPIYGPWFALRAVIVVPGIPPPRLPISQPCICTAACATALDHARAASLPGPTPPWAAWLAVRDACNLRAWRYGDDQIDYHYSRAWSGFGPPAR